MDSKRTTRKTSHGVTKMGDVLSEAQELLDFLDDIDEKPCASSGKKFQKMKLSKTIADLQETQKAQTKAAAETQKAQPKAAAETQKAQPKAAAEKDLEKKKKDNGKPRRLPPLLSDALKFQKINVVQTPLVEDEPDGWSKDESEGESIERVGEKLMEKVQKQPSVFNRQNNQDNGGIIKASGLLETQKALTKAAAEKDLEKKKKDNGKLRRLPPLPSDALKFQKINVVQTPLVEDEPDDWSKDESEGESIERVGEKLMEKVQNQPSVFNRQNNQDNGGIIKASGLLETQKALTKAAAEKDLEKKKKDNGKPRRLPPLLSDALKFQKINVVQTPLVEDEPDGWSKDESEGESIERVGEKLMEKVQKQPSVFNRQNNQDNGGIIKASGILETQKALTKAAAEKDLEKKKKDNGKPRRLPPLLSDALKFQKINVVQTPLVEDEPDGWSKDESEGESIERVGEKLMEKVQKQPSVFNRQNNQDNGGIIKASGLLETQKALTKAAAEKDLEKKKKDNGKSRRLPPLPSDALKFQKINVVQTPLVEDEPDDWSKDESEGESIERVEEKLMEKVQKQPSVFNRQNNQDNGGIIKASGLLETQKALTKAAAEKDLEKKKKDNGKSRRLPPLPSYSSMLKKTSLDEDEPEEELKEIVRKKLTGKLREQSSVFNQDNFQDNGGIIKATAEKDLEKKMDTGKSWGLPSLPSHSPPFQKITVRETPVDEDDSGDWTDDGTEEEIKEMVRKKLMEMAQEQSSAFNQDTYQDNGDIIKASDLQETLEQERRARNALEDALKKAERDNAALQEDLHRERRAAVQQRETLEQEQKEKDALAKALQNEQATNNSLCAEMELTKEKVNELLKSEKEQQLREAQLEDTIADIAAELEESKMIYEDALTDLEAYKEEAELRAVKEQEGILEKDTEIQSLHVNIEYLQSNIEDKDSMIALLQKQVTQQASDLKDLTAENWELQGDYEAAVCQQQKDAEELNHVIQENQQLTSENKRLHGEISAFKEQLMYETEKERSAAVQQRETLEQEQKEKDALAKALQNEQASNKSLCAEMELTKEKVNELLKSEKEQQLREAQLEDTIADITAELEESKMIYEDALTDLEAYKEEAELRAVKEQEGILEKDTEIQSLHVNIEYLQSNIEDKDSMIALLQKQVTQQASDLKDLTAENWELQGDYEAAVCQQQKDAEELNHVIQENQQLTSENKRLHGEISAFKEQLMYETEKERSAAVQQRETLEQEQKEKDALAKALQNEQATNKSLCAEMELTKEKVNELLKSEKEQQLREARLEATIADITAELEESKMMFENALMDLEAYEEEAELRAVKEQEGILEKDTEIQSLHVNIEYLQSDIEEKDSIIASLQEELTQQASDLKDLTAKHCGLQGDYKAAVCQQQREGRELDRLTQENQQLTSENNRLHGEISASKEQHMHKTLRMENADISAKFQSTEKNMYRLKSQHYSFFERHEEMMLKRDEIISQNYCTINKLESMVTKLKAERDENYAEVRALKKRQKERTLEEDTEFQSLHSNIQDLKRLIETKNNIVSSLQEQVSHQASDLKDKTAKHCGLQRDYEAALCQQQKGAEELNRVTQENKRLTSENERLHGEISASEERLTKFDRLKSKYRSLYKRHEEMMLKKENQNNITELKAHESESKKREVELEDALKVEKTRNATLRQEVDQTSSALEQVNAKSAKLTFKLREALIKQKETVKEKNKVVQELQKIWDAHQRIQQVQPQELNFQFRGTIDTELRLN